MKKGKLNSPGVLRIHKLVLDKHLDSLSSDGTLSPGLSGQGDEYFKSALNPSIEILCNNQVMKPNMTLATVRAYIWKKPEDLVLHYRFMPGR
ncbi:hypothetical protein M8C21_025583 [Ambrosia artemisiifolia]|uniref:Uncharacterized protein n=1 Tax=Ambrosia artemisiifolia TaxID=4212 RepID=A0AAD5D9P5_AMBAR|nr:hypothetical protein M8C21_025583 [Ambrosia artemisiifolia]